jgi:hypothetical protein
LAEDGLDDCWRVGMLKTPVLLSDADRLKATLEVHLAEYQAVTTRTSYWITLQYVIYSIAAAYVGWAAGVWGKLDKIAFVWGTAIVLLLLAWAWFQAAWEVLNNAVYMEERLRIKVKRVLGESVSFWGYEPYLTTVRSSGYARFEAKYALSGLFIFTIAALLWLLVSGSHERQWTRGDGFWVLVNLYLAGVVCFKAKEVGSLQQRLWELTKSDRTS